MQRPTHRLGAAPTSSPGPPRQQAFGYCIIGYGNGSSPPTVYEPDGDGPEPPGVTSCPSR